MRNIALILLVLLGVSTQTVAEETEKKVRSKITNVTVFTQGAQIHRKGSTTIPKGTSVLVFEGVSPYINQHSIKASGRGNFTIMDVQYRYVYPEPVEENTVEKDRIQAKIDRLNDSLSNLELVIKSVNEKKSAIATEKNLLINHPLVQGKGKPDSLDLLIGTMEYMENKLKDLADRLFAINIEGARLLKKREGMKNRLYELQNYLNSRPKPNPNKPKHQVLVAVSSSAQINGSVEIIYKVNQAGWSPWYDITAKDAGEDLELVYKAAVYQNTGEDWKNVKLRISNANPNQSNTKPVLPRWYINYYRKVLQRSTKKMPQRYFKDGARVSAEVMKTEEEFEAIEDADVEAKMSYNYTKKMQNFSSIEFDINLPYHILSNGKTHFVTVQKHNLKAQFQHYLVPKLDKDAFVVARITDWENLDLLVGSANIYFGNTFVGRTVLDPSTVNDTLEVSLGRYRSLAVKRTKLKAETKKQVVGAHKIYTATYKIELRNNSSKEISLTLEDQIPLAANSEIEIELTKPDGGKLDETSGLLTWNMKLGPSKKKTIVFTYTVKYPKEKEISGL
jgi:uncharacterized protein (TIGR02231 family)